MKITRFPDYPIHKLKSGLFTDAYFVKSGKVLQKIGYKGNVTMQIFCKKPALLCGVQETVYVLKKCLGKNKNIVIKSLKDGDKVKPWETVMTLEGNYADFAYYETIYLGILARRTSVATNVRKVVEAARGKPVLFFGARFDHFLMQPGDGYAALVGGVSGVSSDANGYWCDVKGMGTIPHALIASAAGNTVTACEWYDSYYGPRANKKNKPIIALVDFDNDCVQTSLECARKLGRRLGGVRLDTSEMIIDKSVKGKSRASHGVCAELVRNVRRALDKEGFKWVQIVVSGGFDDKKVARFVKDKVPFDAVGIGSWFYQDRIDFTADIVRLNGKHCAKVGRKLNPNPKLNKVIF